jgi:hypothetical protein
MILLTAAGAPASQAPMAVTLPRVPQPARTQAASVVESAGAHRRGAPPGRHQTVGARRVLARRTWRPQASHRRAGPGRFVPSPIPERTKSESWASTSRLPRRRGAGLRRFPPRRLPGRDDHFAEPRAPRPSVLNGARAYSSAAVPQLCSVRVGDLRASGLPAGTPFLRSSGSESPAARRAGRRRSLRSSDSRPACPPVNLPRVRPRSSGSTLRLLSNLRPGPA